MLSLFDKVDRSEFRPLLVTLAIVAVMQIAYWPLTSIGEMIPDVRFFGFNNKDLHELYEGWDQMCQKAYIQGNTIDLFLLIPSYTVTLGSWLYRQARNAGKPIQLSLIFLIAAIGDTVETIILGRACLVHPDVLDEKLILVGSLGQQIKIISLGFGTLLLLRNAVKSPIHQTIEKEA